MQRRNKHFYTHLVDSSSISLTLADMDMSTEERRHLLMIVESNLHNTIIDIVLSELPEEDKHSFLKHLHEDNHDAIWKLLQTKAKDIEEKIKSKTEDLVKEFTNDIHLAKAS